jgi:hypothetical protein
MRISFILFTYIERGSLIEFTSGSLHVSVDVAALHFLQLVCTITCNFL